MIAFLRGAALHIMLPLTRAMMYVTTRLLEADRKARGVRQPDHWA